MWAEQADDMVFEALERGIVCIPNIYIMIQLFSINKGYKWQRDKNS